MSEDANRDCDRIRGLLEDFLLNRLDENEAAAVREHLVKCADCRKEESFVHALGHTVCRLEVQDKGYHLSADELAEIAAETGTGRGSGTGARALQEEHLRSCRLCRKALETLREVNADLAALPVDPAEEVLIDRILERENTGSRIRRAIAALLRRPALAGGLAAACVTLVALGIYFGLHLNHGHVPPLGRNRTNVAVRLYRDGIGRTDYYASIEDAERTYAQALDAQDRRFGAGSLEAAEAMMNLGSAYLIAQKFQAARELFEQALAAREQALPPDDPAIGRALCALARAHFVLRDFVGAEALYRRGLDVFERSLGPDHPDVAIASIGIAESLGSQWRHAEGEPFYARALRIRRVALRSDDPDLPDAMMRLGNLYKQLARYSEARELFAEAVQVRKKTLDPADPEIAMSLDHVAEIYQREGKYNEAGQLYREALEVRKASLGPNHPDVGAGYHYLGNISLALGQYDEAESYYRLGLKLREKLGRNHPDVATSLTDVAAVNELKGNYKEAEKLYRRALAIREETLGESRPGVPNPGVAMSLGDLAGLFTREHRYEEAEPLYSKALSIWETSMGKAHPAAASALESMSDLYRLEGKGDLAIDASRRATEIRCENLVQNAEFMTEEDALSYSQFLRNSLSSYLADVLTFGAANPTEIARAADLIFRSKGEISDQIFDRQRKTADSKDPKVRDLTEDLRLCRGRLAELTFGGSSDLSSRQSEIDSLRQEADRIETELAQVSAEFERARYRNDITAARVASALPQGSTLVEFVKFGSVPRDLAPRDSAPSYLALVLGRDGNPTITDLGEAREIDDLVMSYRAHMAKIADPEGTGLTASSAEEYRQISRRLFAAIWQPIEDHVAGNLVLIAPDGALNAVSFAALEGADGKYLVEKLPLHYLASGRDLIRLEGETTRGSGLLALGDPDYSAPVAMRLKDFVAPEESEIQLASLTRNVRSSDDEMAKLPPAISLPGTRKEVEEVAAAWRNVAGGPEEICLGPGASEERFKAEAEGKRVIHIATHGFFLDAGDSAVGNPLLLSGLLLSGANLRGRDSDQAGAEDGILTAYEISAMNLDGTDLVVLSACETGLGEIRAGEGVYGLCRSFQMAGARTVVSALWDISDADGIVTDLCTGIFGRGSGSLPGAIRTMQLEQIRQIRARGGIDHPYSWGAFIASGDWR